jgi:uncharacterized membrane protein
MISRVLKHLVWPDWWQRRYLPEAALDRVKERVVEAERAHDGEIRVAVEASLDLPTLLRGVTARERAVEVFSRLRVWDTEANNGVLLYVLLADRDVEIVADRGVARLVLPSEWEQICHEMEGLFREGKHEAALLLGTGRIGEILTRVYPEEEKQANQLPDRPAVLK